MNHVIAKITGGGSSYKKVVSDKLLYSLPEDLSNPITYDPDHNLDEDQWFGIENFSSRSYCLELMKHEFNSTDYDAINAIDTNKIEFLCSYQDNNEYYFQRVTKSQMMSKKWLSWKHGMSDQMVFEENTQKLVINSVADAIYLKNKDTLYFKKLQNITAIFKGIDDLYRVATEQETINFLNSNFINLENGFCHDKVKKTNRQRIAMATDTLNRFSSEEKDNVFDYIKEYCVDLTFSDNAFTVSSEKDLKLLLYGIEQRYYTTPVGGEKRLANSIILI